MRVVSIRPRDICENTDYSSTLRYSRVWLQWILGISDSCTPVTPRTGVVRQRLHVLPAVGDEVNVDTPRTTIR